MNRSKLDARGAIGALVALIILCLLEEVWLVPLRPGGSWMVLKIVPLLLCLRGVIRHDNYTMQWSSMLILLYFAEGVVRATSDRTTMGQHLSWLEVALSLLFFYFTLSYLRPIKKAAKLAALAARTTEDTLESR
jgi:uncharacterized membrane protein